MFNKCSLLIAAVLYLRGLTGVWEGAQVMNWFVGCASIKTYHSELQTDCQVTEVTSGSRPGLV